MGVLAQLEAFAQVLGQGGDAAGVSRQFVVAEFERVGGFGEGFVGGALFVGGVEDGFEFDGDFGGQFAVFQTVCPVFDLRVLLFFALDGGQGLFEGVFGGGFEDAFALFVEVHRGGVEGDEGGGQLGFGRGAAVVFGGGFGGGEFFRAAGFPQQAGIDLRGFGLRGGEEGGGVAVEFGEDAGGFDFGAFAAEGVGLVGGFGFLDDAGGFELSGFFVKDVHGGFGRAGVNGGIIQIRVC